MRGTFFCHMDCDCHHMTGGQPKFFVCPSYNTHLPNHLDLPDLTMVNPLPPQLDGVMTYADLVALHQANQLDADGTQFFYAVNKRSGKSTTPEGAFLHQKRIALDARLRREAARYRPAVISIIPSSVPSSSFSSSAPTPPENVREQCRIIMDMLRFDPPGRIIFTDPRLLLTLPAPVQQMLMEETLTVGQAQVLLVLNDSDNQVRLAERASHEKMSVSAMEEYIAAAFHISRCVQCPNKLSRQVCQCILELWIRGQLQAHHVRFLLRELMSVRLMEEIGGGERAPQIRNNAAENSCFISRKFAQGVFVPSFSGVDQYRIQAPLSSADSIFDLLWLHRKQGLHVVKDVAQLALNHHGEREATWLLAVIDLQTHVVSMLSRAPSNPFQQYLEDLRCQLDDRLQELDAEFNQPQPVSDDAAAESREEEVDDEHDTVGIELRQVANDLEQLQQHCTAVELREQALRRRADEQKRREELQRREEEERRIKETFRYKHLVEREVAARYAEIRAQVMKDYRDEIREQMRKQRKELTVAWKKKVQDGLDEWDHAQSLGHSPTEAKAWMKMVRQQERRMRYEKLAEWRKDGFEPKHQRIRARVTSADEQHRAHQSQ